MQSENNDLEEAIYSKEYEEVRCDHVFKRISPTKVECVNCHAGFYDSPDDPFPIDDYLTEFYNDPKNREYFKWHS